MNLFQIFNKSQINLPHNTLLCSKILREHQPKNVQEWEDLFDKHSKRNLKEAAKFVYDFADGHDIYLDKRDVYNFVKKIFIDCTFKGYLAEIKFVEFANEISANYVYELSDYMTDLNLGIDVVCKNKFGKVVKCYQIKPSNYQSNVTSWKDASQAALIGDLIPFDIITYDTNFNFESKGNAQTFFQNMGVKPSENFYFDVATYNKFIDLI